MRAAFSVLVCLAVVGCTAEASVEVDAGLDASAFDSGARDTGTDGGPPRFPCSPGEAPPFLCSCYAGPAPDANVHVDGGAADSCTCIPSFGCYDAGP